MVRLLRTTDNEWYITEHRAKLYFKGVFCAKMINTETSESANYMLKSYMPPAALCTCL